jgi:hypothetical protein
MTLTSIKIELALPAFFGPLAALLLCGFVAARESGPYDLPQDQDTAIQAAGTADPVEGGAVHLFTGPGPEYRDIIQELYRESETRDRVTGFFTDFCSSTEIAGVILLCADAFNVPPALAFALAWEESRFNPHAVNTRNRDESIDRGLFQLNSRSFPRLETAAFFDPAVNARYGMAHLRHCLDTGGSEIAALAMYNAGTGRVNSSGAPRVTLDYVNRILENRRRIETRFQNWLRQETGIAAAEHPGTHGFPDLDFLLEGFSEKIAEAQPVRFRFFVPLVPLAGTR